MMQTDKKSVAIEMTYLRIRSEREWDLHTGCRQKETWPFLEVRFVKYLPRLWQDEIYNIGKFRMAGTGIKGGMSVAELLWFYAIVPI